MKYLCDCNVLLVSSFLFDNKLILYSVPSKPVDNIVAEWRCDSSILVRWTPLSYKEARGFPFYIIYEALDGSSRGNTTSIDDSVVIFGLNPQIGYDITVDVTTDKGSIRGNHTLRSGKACTELSFSEVK